MRYNWVMARPPLPDPSLDPFRDGLAALTADGAVMGHIATSVEQIWSLGSPFRRQWIVRLVVVWSDGTKEQAAHDWAPWTYVTEMKQGFIEWRSGRDSPRQRRYDVSFLSPTDGLAERERLGITAADFLDLDDYAD